MKKYGGVILIAILSLLLCGAIFTIYKLTSEQAQAPVVNEPNEPSETSEPTALSDSAQTPEPTEQPDPADTMETQNQPSAEPQEVSLDELLGNATPSPEEQAAPQDLGISLVEFKKRFNAAAKSVEFNQQIADFKTNEGDGITTSLYMFNDNLGLVVSSYSEGNIYGLIMLGSGDGTAQSGSDMLLCMGSIMTAINPELSATQRGDVLRELGLLDENTDINNHNASCQRENIKYTFMGSEVLGVQFIVDFAREKDAT